MKLGVDARIGLAIGRMMRRRAQIGARPHVTIGHMTRTETARSIPAEGSVADAGSGSPPLPMPLTERVLFALPGPRLFWVVAWSCIALLRLGALLAILELTGATAGSQASAGSALGQAVLGFLVLATLVGTPILVRRVQELTPVLEAIAPSRPTASWFPRITSVAGPLLLVAIAVAVSLPSTLADFGVVVAVADIVLLGAVVLPMMTFVWAYGTLLLGLDRLGRADLALDDFPQDRALGLGPIGSVAMTGFWVLVLGAAPLLIFAGSDLTTVGTSVTILAVVVGLFVLSMLRLHGQMRTAKAGYVAMTRRLIAEAYAPVRASTDLSTLQASKPTLDAAQSLAERADRLLEWPIDERMIAWITVVVTGVATGLVVRFVLQVVGA